MTLIVGNVVDVGLAGVDGTLRVWAWFRPEEVGLIAPYRREWEITGGEIEAGVDVIPGPAAVEIDCGPNAYTTVDVTVPDAESVTIQDLFEQVYSYTPGVVSEAWEARRGAEAAALEAELSAGEAEVSAGRALTSEGAAALHAATLSARVDQGTQTVMFTSDGQPYLADPATIEHTPLVLVDTGWRNVDHMVVNGWTAITARVRHVNGIVMVSLYGLQGPSGFTPLSLFLDGLPVGFRASMRHGFLMPQRSNLARAAFGAVENGALYLTDLHTVTSTNVDYNVSISFPAATHPDTGSLPGTPA